MNKMSKGEQKVANILTKAGIAYRTEVEFKGLKGGKGNLRFDFVCYKNGRIWVCIEVDGRQHFEYTPYFHKTKVAFRRQKEHDIKKNKFCIQNGIPLIRVPYWKLDTLTYQTLFHDITMRVHDSNHNINLMKDRGVK